MVFGMGSGDNTLEIEIAAAGEQGFTSAMNTVSNSVQSVRKNALLAGSALAGIGAAGAAGIGNLMSQSSDIETSFAEVSTLMEEGQDAAEVFGDDVANLSTEFAAHGGEAEVIEGLYSTLSAGIDEAGEATEFMETAMKAGTAGLADTQTAVDALSTVVNGYGLEAEEAEDVSDVMFETIREGKTTFPELASGIGDVVPMASEMGVGIEEVGAATATLTAQGQDTSKAMTSLRQTLTTLMDPPEELADHMNDLGFESGKAMIESEGLGGTLQTLRDSADESGQEMSELFPNVRSLGAVLPIAGESAEAFNENLETTQNAAGSTEQAFDEMSDTAEFQLRQAMNEVRVSMRLAGDAFLSALLPAITPVTDAIGTLADMFKSLDDEQREFIARGAAVATAATIAAGAFLVLSAVGPAVVAAIAPIAGTLAVVAAAATALWLAWETNFLGIQDITEEVIGVITEAIEWFVDTAEELWERFGDDIISTITTTLEIVENAIETYLSGWFRIFEALVSPIVSLWDRFGSDLTSGTSESFGTISSVIESTLGYIYSNVIEPIMSAIGTIWERYIDTIVYVIETAFSTIGTVVETTLGYVWESVIQPILGTIQAFWDRFGDDIIGITEWIFETYQTVVMTYLEFVYNNVISPILEAVQLAWDRFGSTILSATRTAFDTISSVIDSTLGFVYDEVIAPFIEIINDVWDEHGEELVEETEETFNAIKSFVDSTLGELYREVIQPILEAVSEFWDEHGEEIMNATREMAEFVNDRVSTLMEWLEPYISKAMSAIETVVTTVLGVLEKAWDLFGEDIMSVVSFLFEYVKTVFEQGLDTVLTTVRTILALVRGDFDEAGEMIRGLIDRTVGRVIDLFYELKETLVGNSIIPDMISDIRSLFEDFLSFITDTWDLLGGVTEVFDDAKDAATSIIADLVSDVKGMLRDLIPDIGDLTGRGADKLKDTWNNAVPSTLSIPSVSVGGQSISIPSTSVGGRTIGGGSLSVPSETVGGGGVDLPQLAQGGVVTDPTAAIIGEGGEDEAVLPLSNLRGLVEGAASRGAATDRDGGPGTVIRNVEINAETEQGGRAAARGFTDELRSMGFNDA